MRLQHLGSSSPVASAVNSITDSADSLPWLAKWDSVFGPSHAVHVTDVKRQSLSANQGMATLVSSTFHACLCSSLLCVLLSDWSALPKSLQVVPSPLEFLSGANTYYRLTGVTALHLISRALIISIVQRDLCTPWLTPPRCHHPYQPTIVRTRVCAWHQPLSLCVLRASVHSSCIVIDEAGVFLSDAALAKQRADAASTTSSGAPPPKTGMVVCSLVIFHCGCNALVDLNC